MLLTLILLLIVFSLLNMECNAGSLCNLILKIFYEVADAQLIILIINKNSINFEDFFT